MGDIKIHEFNPVIYPYKLWIIVNKTPDFISNDFLNYEGTEIESFENTKMLDAFVMPAQKKDKSYYGVIIYFTSKKSMTYNIVAHESSHAAKYLFEHIGCDINHHEPFEYVIGWIAECCEKVLKNKE